MRPNCLGILLSPNEIQSPNPGCSCGSFQGGKIQQVTIIASPAEFQNTFLPYSPLTQLYLGPLLTSCRANRAWACQLKSTPRVNLTHISLACEGIEMGSKGEGVWGGGGVEKRGSKEVRLSPWISVNLHFHYTFLTLILGPNRKCWLLGA